MDFPNGAMVMKTYKPFNMIDYLNNLFTQSNEQMQESDTKVITPFGDENTHVWGAESSTIFNLTTQRLLGYILLLRTSPLETPFTL